MRAHASPETANQPLSNKAFYASSAVLVFLIYLATFRLSGGDTLLADMAASVRNLIPLSLLTLALRPVLIHRVIDQPIMKQVPLHLVIGATFSLAWYWSLMLAIGIASGESLTRFRVEPFFDDPAFAWQLLQGAAAYTTIYAVEAKRIAERRCAAVFERDMQRSSGSILSPENPRESAEGAPDRYFVRRGDDILPVSIESVLWIEGADDYAEVVTTDARHLVRLTLAELERVLDPSKFLRIHRSRIVNLNQVKRAEPAGGGRLLLHLENGSTIQTSRSGTRAFRQRLI